MWELDFKESWMFNNWCFWILVLENTLEIPLDCKEIQPVHPKVNHSWIFIGRMMFKLKFQYCVHLMWTDSFEKTLMLGMIERRRRRAQQKMRWLDDITDSMHMSLGELRVLVMSREAWRAAIHGVTKSWTRLGDFCLFCYETLYLSQFSPSVVSDSLQPHGLLHARPPYPSWTSRVYSNSCPLSWWCYPTISSSVVPFSTCLHSFPTSGSFWMFSSSYQVAKVLEFQLHHQSFQ